MSSTLYRVAELARADEAGRSVFGRVCPYGETVTVDDGMGAYRERFEPGAFTRSIAERGHKVRLFIQHETRRFPIGKATELREAVDGVHAAFALPRTRDADEALELVSAGVVDGFSVGFRPVRDRREGGVTVRVEAALHEVSLVHSPAYAGALVAGVRSADNRLHVEIARRRLDLILRTW